MARKDKAGIYVDAQYLFDALYKAQFEMPKKDRCVIAVRLLDHCERHMDAFLASMNSYCGLLKGKNEYKNIKHIVSAISPEWMNYVDFNEDRLCLEAKNGYKHKNVINYKFARL